MVSQVRILDNAPSTNPGGQQTTAHHSFFFLLSLDGFGLGPKDLTRPRLTLVQAVVGGGRGCPTHPSASGNSPVTPWTRPAVPGGVRDPSQGKGPGCKRQA